MTEHRLPPTAVSAGSGKWPFWTRFRIALADWRYPAALAAAMLLASVLIAQVVTLQGYREMLDRLNTRANTAECVDRQEAKYELAISAYLAAEAAEDTAGQAQAISMVDEAVSPEAIAACYAGENGD